MPKLQFAELKEEENNAVNESIKEILRAAEVKKKGGRLSDALKYPIMPMEEIASFKSQNLTNRDLKEMQREIDKEVAAFVNTSEAAAIPIVGRIVVSIVASKTAKIICRKINC